MENKHLRLFAAVAVLCLNGSTWAQALEAELVKGELHANSPAVFHGEVRLTSLHGGLNNVAEAQVGGDGRFEFRRVPFGDYRLTVVDASNRPIYEELITVHEQPQPIDVEVTLQEDPKPASGVVSAQELLHPPTKKAFKAFLAAQKFADSGEHEKAAAQFQKAIELSPGYTAAWVNLGAQHIFLKRYEQALQELAHSIEISYATPLILCDMAYAHYALHHYAEGTHAALQALQLDPSSVQAHYLLGSVLALDRRTRAEGLQHLEVAARTMPAAQAELERARHESAQVVTHP